MAKNGYIGIDNKARKIGKIYIGINGIARKVKKVYIGDANGKARLCYTAGTPIGSLAVGTTVYSKTNVSYFKWTIVHQGLPSSAYDSSCNGTWLLAQSMISETFTAFGGNNDYGASGNSIQYMFKNQQNIVSNHYLTNIYNSIKTVTLPYTKYNGTQSSISTKLFILSACEMGFTSSDMSYNNQYFPTTGAKLDYFTLGSDYEARVKRMTMYDDGESDEPYLNSYWTRDPYMYDSAQAFYVGDDGGLAWEDTDAERPLRLAFILPSTALVDENLNIIG